MLYEVITVKARREVRREIERRANGDVINSRVADSLDIMVVVHSRPYRTTGPVPQSPGVYSGCRPRIIVSMKKLLISNARLVNEGEIRDADVLVRGDRIDKIAAGIPADDSVEVIDAEGRYLIPGMIDDQVHFREPGLTAT